MTTQKFAVGQLVNFDTGAATQRKAIGPFAVTRVLPQEDGKFRTYRIKSATEPFERSAVEYEIIAARREDAR